MPPPYEEGTWYMQLGRLKCSFLSLTDQDLTYLEKQRPQMVSALSEKLGIGENKVLEVMNGRKRNPR